MTPFLMAECSFRHSTDGNEKVRTQKINEWLSELTSVLLCLVSDLSTSPWFGINTDFGSCTNNPSPREALFFTLPCESFVFDGFCLSFWSALRQCLDKPFGTMLSATTTGAGSGAEQLLASLVSQFFAAASEPVSYTHLTLPTILRV